MSSTQTAQEHESAVVGLLAHFGVTLADLHVTIDDVTGFDWLPDHGGLLHLTAADGREMSVERKYHLDGTFTASINVRLQPVPVVLDFVDRISG